MGAKLVVFKDKQIRRIFVEDEWHFAAVDVVAALTDSEKPCDYWYRMKKLPSADGKQYLTEPESRKRLTGKKST